MQHLRLIIAWIAGSVEALLAARLVAKLLAARPDNPVVQMLYTLSDPLVTPLGRLDMHQPRFGAVLELSTLLLIIIIPLVGYGVWRALRSP